MPLSSSVVIQGQWLADAKAETAESVDEVVSLDVQQQNAAEGGDCNILIEEDCWYCWK